MFFVLTGEMLLKYTNRGCRGAMGNAGQVMVEYILLISFLILGLVTTFGFLREGLFQYYRFMVTIVCLPIP